MASSFLAPAEILMPARATCSARFDYGDPGVKGPTRPRKSKGKEQSASAACCVALNSPVVHCSNKAVKYSTGHLPDHVIARHCGARYPPSA